jgi:hypothetical protein
MRRRQHATLLAALLVLTRAEASPFHGTVTSLEFSVTLTGLSTLQVSVAPTVYAAPFTQFTAFATEARVNASALQSCDCSTGLLTTHFELVAQPGTFQVTQGALGGPLPLEFRFRGQFLSTRVIPLAGQGGSASSATTQAGIWTAGVANVTTPSGAVLHSTGSVFEPLLGYTTTFSGGLGTYFSYAYGSISLVKPLFVHSAFGGTWTGFSRMTATGIFSVPEPSTLYGLLLPGSALLAAALRRGR